MARVRPFRGLRYTTPTRDITPLTAPPYDIIGEEQRVELLTRSPHNIVAVELPEGSPDPSVAGNRYERAASMWSSWARESVIGQDGAAAIYVLEQEWTHSGMSARRRAFIVALALERFEDSIVLPHERTLPKALDDRLGLTRACKANFSQVFGLFSDPGQESPELLDTATDSEPIEVARGDDGVESRLWAVADPTAIARIERLFADKQVFIADGHHRYSTALAYRDERRAAGSASASAPTDGAAGGEADTPAYDFVMMALVNMDDPELVVLPTHRVADAVDSFEAAEFWRGLEPFFDIEALPSGRPSDVLLGEGRPRFIVQTRDGQRRIVRLKDDIDLDKAVDVPFSSAWKHLDVAVLQELVLSPLLGIHPDRPGTLDRLRFVKDAHEALSSTSEHDVAFILRATRMDQLREVALAGEIMPQKSTYFYPKLLSGMVMRSLE